MKTKRQRNHDICIFSFILSTYLSCHSKLANQSASCLSKTLYLNTFFLHWYFTFLALSHPFLSSMGQKSHAVKLFMEFLYSNAFWYSLRLYFKQIAIVWAWVSKFLCHSVFIKGWNWGLHAVSSSTTKLAQNLLSLWLFVASSRFDFSVLNKNKNGLDKMYNMESTSTYHYIFRYKCFL